MDFWSRPRKQKLKFSTEIDVISETSESSHVQIRSESGVDFFLRSEENFSFRALSNGTTQKHHVDKANDSGRRSGEKEEIHREADPGFFLTMYLRMEHLFLLARPRTRPFFVFPKLKTVLKGTQHGDMKTMKKATTDELKNLPEESFMQCMQSWKKRMDKCLQFYKVCYEGS